MRVELNDKKLKCKLLEIEQGYCFLSPKNEICIKTNETIKSCCIDDTYYFVCVNLINGELFRISPKVEVMPLDLKVVEK